MGEADGTQLSGWCRGQWSVVVEDGCRYLAAGGQTLAGQGTGGVGVGAHLQWVLRDQALRSHDDGGGVGIKIRSANDGKEMKGNTI
jgi:hypothetical protein